MEAKSALRREVLQRRAALTGEQRATAEQGLVAALAPVLSSATRVAAYAAIGSEPPTTALLALCAEVLLPVLRPDGDLDWARAGTLQPGPKGLLEPVGERLGRDALSSCDVVLVPALAVDRSGHRLGRGGGSYDRALPRATGLTIALLYDGEVVDALPTEPHDATVAAAATPSGGLLRF